MATVKRCDRCSAIYEKNFHHTITVGCNKSRLTGMCMVTDYDESIKDRDLCDDCITKLLLFMDGRELKEE